MNPSSEGLLPAWLCNFSSLAIFTFDTDGKIIDKSNSFKEIFSHGNDLFLSIDSVFEKTDAEKLITATKTVSHTGNKTHIVVLHDKIKNMYTCEYTLVKHCDELKKIFAAIITKDEEIARLIEYNKEWIDAFFNNSPGSAWVTNEAGEMLLMNSLSKELVGLGNDYKNKTLWDIYPQNLADVFFENNKQVIETNEMLITEENFIDKYGRSRISLVYKFPLTTKSNKRLVGGWSIDITERKKAEQKITEHNLKIKELAFLQSHEVRRPLANILGLIQLIHSDEKNFQEEDLMRLLNYIKTSAFELDDIIKKVIDKLREE